MEAARHIPRCDLGKSIRVERLTLKRRRHLIGALSVYAAAAEAPQRPGRTLCNSSKKVGIRCDRVD
jgi:hypothetical protein